MKLFFSVIFLFCLQAKANESLKLEFNLTNAHLEQYQGHAQLNKLIYHNQDEQINYTNLDVILEQNGDELSLNSQDQSLVIKNKFIAELSKFEVENFKGQTNKKEMSSSLDYAFLNHKNDDYELHSMSTYCQGQQTLIESCLQNGRLSVSSLKFDETRIRDFLIKSGNKDLYFAANVSGIGKIKGYGSSVYLKDQLTLRVKIDKVKLSFLNITSRFFDEIKDLESDSVRVEKPYLYIKLSKETLAL